MHSDLFAFDDFIKKKFAEFSIKAYHCLAGKILILVPEKSMTYQTENKNCFDILAIVSNCITLNRLDLLAP